MKVLATFGENFLVLIYDNKRTTIEENSPFYEKTVAAMRAQDDNTLISIIEELNQPELVYHETDNTLVIEIDRNTIQIGVGDRRFNSLKKALKEKNFKAVRDIADPSYALAGTDFSMKDNKIYYQNEELPPALSSRMRKMILLGLDLNIMIKFWENLNKNPSFNSRKMLYSFLEKNGHALTEDGHFLAYKTVQNNFLDKHSGKFDNSPGKVVEMDRSLVNDNPNDYCSSGLHFASWNYARNHFHNGSSDKMVMVKINPADVVAVPHDYNGEKCRGCKYEVISEVTEMNNEEVFGTKKTMADFDRPLVNEDETEEFDKDVQNAVVNYFNEFSSRYGSDREMLIKRIYEELDSNGDLEDVNDDFDEDSVEQILVGKHLLDLQ